MNMEETPPKEDDFGLYLEPTFVIDSDSEILKERATLLTEEHSLSHERAIRLFNFVRDKIEYNPYRAFRSLHLSDYCASRTLHRGDGYCIQKAVVLTALARAVGIPARLGFADVINHPAPKKLVEMMGTNVFIYHGYSELWLDDRWIKATPAFNIGMCRRFGIKPVEFDGVSDSILHKTDERGELHIEYIRYRGTYADLPFEEIMQAFRKQYAHTQDKLE
jgi:transglutaminase-like putative cysteine protease